MNTNIAYLVIASLLVMVFLVTRNIKTVDSEYFVLDKTEKTFGLTMSFYASGMGLWILTSPAEVAWYGLGYDIYGYAISAAVTAIITASADFKLYVSKVFNPPSIAKSAISLMLF